MTSQREMDAAYAGWKRSIVERANANRARITKDFTTVLTIVDSASMVFGVWQDLGEPDGIGMLLVKGHALCRQIVASGRAWPVDMTAISCTCAEQAEALRIVAGEKEMLN